MLVQLTGSITYIMAVTQPHFKKCENVTAELRSITCLLPDYPIGGSATEGSPMKGKYPIKYKHLIRSK